MATAQAAATDARPVRLRLIVAALMLVLLLASLDQTIVSTALPTIVGELGGLNQLSWVVTAYLLALTVVTPLYGKLGDLYGRKVVLQGALVLFLLGSALCGAAQSMTELIAFRALQGLGGGGLLVSAMAAIGDVVPPRQRGRYSGLFGGVFGVSSVLGPLIGGFFTTHLSWRWIFYINLPLGALALVALAVALPSMRARVQHAIDYAGTVLLAIGLSALVLATTLGGTTYAWGSWQIVGLGVASVVALAAFVAVERRVAEPILPPRLFRNRVFAVTCAVGLVVGFALFGSLTYLPLFQQVVRGDSPTESGLQLVPVVVGVLLGSIGSGAIITRTGRYKLFPIAGTAVAAVGLLLLSTLDAGTSVFAAGVYMLVLGFGLGLVMQVLVLAAQNAVDYEELGVATSGATLFRSIGGSLGTAVLGAIFTNRLSNELAARLPRGGGTTGALESGRVSPTGVQRLPGPIHDAYVGAFTASLSTVFVVAACVVAVAFLLTFLLEERPLRQTVDTAGVGEAFAAPRDGESLSEIARELSVLAGRERTREFIERTVARAALNLTPEAGWVLLRAARGVPLHDLEALAGGHDIPRERLLSAIHELLDYRLVEGGVLTPLGVATAQRLLDARRRCFIELVDDWRPDGEDPRLNAAIERLAAELAADAPAPEPEYAGVR